MEEKSIKHIGWVSGWGKLGSLSWLELHAAVIESTGSDKTNILLPIRVAEKLNRDNFFHRLNDVIE